MVTDILYACHQGVSVSRSSVSIVTTLLAAQSTRPGSTPGRSKRCRSPLVWVSPVHWVLRALSVGVYSWWDMKLTASARVNMCSYTSVLLLYISLTWR